jgi:hypothetical protein
MPKRDPDQTAVPEEEMIFIGQASELLDRRIGTLRLWDEMGVLPLHLRPQRGPRRWRYWTPLQIEGIKEWIIKTDRRPGTGLPHIKSRPDHVAATRQIHNMRKPRTRRNDA